LIVFNPSHLLAYEAGRTVIKGGTVSEDLYVAGGTVRVFAEAEGDVVAAGGRVIIGQLVKGDVIVAGGSVNVRARVLDDIRAAGGDVILEGEVGGDAIAAGGNVSLAPETTIGGRAWLAGGHVEVAGSIGKELKAAGRTITIAGNVQGDVELVAQKIEILPTARIQGNLTYRSPQEAKIDPSAQIEGKVSYIQTGLRYTPMQRAIFRVLFFLSLMVVGIVLFLLFPNFTVSAGRTIGSDPWKSLGLGLALLVTTPFVGGLLMATVLGIPLALMLFAIYSVSLLAGFLTAVFFLGEWEVRFLRRGPELSRSWRILSIILALIGLWLIQLIPVVGCVVLFLALLFGIGALGLQTYRTYTIAHS
jgi:cytoskeletal protein CcmA (bactofilin family)